MLDKVQMENITGAIRPPRVMDVLFYLSFGRKMEEEREVCGAESKKDKKRILMLLYLLLGNDGVFFSYFPLPCF